MLFLGYINALKYVCVWGFVLNPTAGSYSAPLDYHYYSYFVVITDNLWKSNLMDWDVFRPLCGHLVTWCSISRGLECLKSLLNINLCHLKDVYNAFEYLNSLDFDNILYSL